MRLSATLLLPLALLAACAVEGDDLGDTDEGPPPPPLVAGAPMAGAAEGTLKLPVGTPLAGFTARCGCLGSFSKQDDRDSAYNSAFIESTGVHVRPTIKALWIENGDKHLVITKTDTIYSFDGLVDHVTERLEELTGEELSGMVIHNTNHNHSSYGTFSQHTGLFLGHDKFNRENHERMVEQIVQVAYEAYQTRQAASIGVGQAKDWDPTNRVYSDRRGENNDLVMWDDMGPEQGGKDPYLSVIRVDAVETGDPIAVAFSWGMHPFVFGERMSLATGDATVLAEMEVAESFDTPVVAMFLQGPAGDTSVRGSDDGWARMETVGVYARDPILDLWAATKTSSEDILVETYSRSVPMNREAVHVTRNGTVDWKYPPYKPSELYKADDIIYTPDGEIDPKFDEFNTNTGAVFCGSGDFDLPVGGLVGTQATPYKSCMQIGFMTILLETFFRLEPEQVTVPLDGMRTTYTAASKLSGVPMRRADGSDVTTDLLMAFFPGEPLHMFAEQFRRRAKAELGVEDAIVFGYSMDHEGYLAIPEDWLLGGYEPDITFWGPLAAEYVMEDVLAYGESVLNTDLAEPFDPKRGPDTYPEVPLETEQPDITPEAGTKLTNATLPDYYWVPEGFRVDLDVPEEVPRITGMIQVGWIGGDPGVDDPRVTLQREVAEGVWEAVTSHTGRPINDDMQDFAIGYTPDPLFPSSVQQTHYWWTVWQAVGHIRDRAGLPEGTYRLHIQGHKYTGGNTTYPWNSEAYEVVGDAFTIVPAQVTLSNDVARMGFWASLEGPADSFRMIDIDGRSRGHNPLRGDLTVSWTTVESGTFEEVLTAGAPEGNRTLVPWPAGETVTAVTVTDAYGNTGTWD